MNTELPSPNWSIHALVSGAPVHHRGAMQSTHTCRPARVVGCLPSGFRWLFRQNDRAMTRQATCTWDGGEPARFDRDCALANNREDRRSPSLGAKPLLTVIGTLGTLIATHGLSPPSVLAKTRRYSHHSRQNVPVESPVGCPWAPRFSTGPFARV